ncbi:hypothetical protein BPMI_01404 [Candidatus Burkholderia pumila]|uniref:Flagellar basal body-associated protein FliL n=1 Tax=Candidatus Burkholderia pumila TaxID=1090375 RepID=A0ABR5HKV9_9BURK|nr:hypothetical protein BPMI_01404 [Candidatus Burkholderia pumila]
MPNNSLYQKRHAPRKWRPRLQTRKTLPPAKSGKMKKILMIAIGAIVLLGAGAGGAYFLLGKQVAHGPAKPPPAPPTSPCMSKKCCSPNSSSSKRRIIQT